MSVNLKQLGDGSAGLEGVDGDDGAIALVQINYSAALTSTSMFTAPRACVIKSIRGRVDVSGTGGACTVAFFNTPSGTAGASGKAVHTGSFNIAGTANASQSLVLSTTTANLRMAAGDSIFLVLTGTPTSAVGNFSVGLNPA